MTFWELCIKAPRKEVPQKSGCNELEFIEEGSMNFPYVKVKNGEKFIGKPLE